MLFLLSMALEQKYKLLPSEYADELGTKYSSNVEKEHKKKFGQYFTPKEVAEYMASFYTPSEEKRSVRVLDPGCGLGILSCALCERLIEFNHIREIDLVVFETDLQLIDIAHQVFGYLQEWLREKGIRFNYFLCANDFILHNTSVLLGDENPTEVFDVAISNPPYFKISKNDPLSSVAKSILYGQQNIYSVFIILIVKLLAPTGTLIFISPRSFTSGSYFRAFRDFLFREVKLEWLHLFHSRKKVFKRDKVLQENLIVYARKRNIQAKVQSEMPIYIDYVNISKSQGIEDISTSDYKKYQISDLVNLDSYQKIFHIPVSERDEAAISVFKCWTNSFCQSKIKISTGPVVSFRANGYIVKEGKKNTVPLIWLNNIGKMDLNWPLLDISKERPQYFIETKESLPLLIDNRNMVIIRRFSSKDDASKLIAAPFFKRDFTYKRIGLENHVNYVYGIEKELSIDCVWGITALLNSTLFDVYFRTFNGNINVSATELRELPLPKIEIILNLGATLKKTKNLDQVKLDKIVNKTFNLTK